MWFPFASSIAVITSCFFVWLSVFNLFVVSVFWSYMSDLFDSGQAARLYGTIAAGGSCGAIAGPLLAASLVVRMVLQGSFGLGGHPWSFRFFPSELALFLAGSLGYYVHASRTMEQRTRLTMLLTGVAVLVFACLAINRWDGMTRLTSLALLAAVIVSVPRLFEITGKLAWDKYIGELSYPFYICHFLFGWLVLPSTYLAVHSALLLTLAASVAIYHLLDRPIDAWRQNRLRKTDLTVDTGRLLASV